jgi:cyclopropane fatty-acyl-phospholipid synthase-like methyltransferase
MRHALPLCFVLACGTNPPPPSAPPTATSADAGAATATPEAGGPAAPPAPLGHRFEKAMEWVKAFDDPSRDAWQKPHEVVKLMKIDPGMTVADIGAGTGYFLPVLSKAVGEKGKVLAVDIEPDMIRHMTERAAKEKLANVTPQLAETNDPKLPAGKVDRILIVNTWHHIPMRVPYVAKLKQALAPGGAIYIVDYTPDAKRGPPAEERVSVVQCIAELTSGGMGAQALDETLPDQYVIMATPR